MRKAKRYIFICLLSSSMLSTGQAMESNGSKFSLGHVDMHILINQNQQNLIHSKNNISIPFGCATVVLEGKGPMITLKQIVSGQIAKSYQNLRLNNINGRQEKIFEKYMAALKKAFGEHPKVVWEEYCPEPVKKSEVTNRELLTWFKEYFFSRVIDRENFITIKEWLKEDAEQILKEAEEIEQFFHRLFASEKTADIYKITGTAMTSLLEILNDKHAIYYSKKTDADAFLDYFSSPYNNYRCRFHSADGKFYICDVIRGTADALAGIKEGDEILSINGKEISKETEQPQELLKGTDIDFKLRRGEEILSITSSTSEAKVPLVTSEQFEDIGYIKITSFGEKTALEFKNELSKLKENHIKRLVIDLRNNGGGTSRSCKETLSILMDNQHYETLMFSERKKVLKQYTDPAQKIDIDVPIILIINKGTGSSSEGMVGAIKDHFDAKIVGETTFGKGQGQQIIQGPLLTAIKHTVYEMTSPKGIRYNGIGFLPDYVVTTASAQKIAALRLAGINNFDICVRDYAVIINRAEPIFADFFIDDAGNAPTDFLASLLGREWSIDENIIIKNHDQTMQKSMPIKHYYKDGRPYSSINAFTKLFPEVTYENKNNQHFFRIKS